MWHPIFLYLQGSHFLVIQKNASDLQNLQNLQVMSQLLGSDRPVRSSILYLLALGYSQKIDPREWREKPLLIWYDAGRREQHWNST